MAKDEKMKLSKTGKKTIAGEFRIIANLINEENDVLSKAYYFSGAYGVVQRVLNIEYTNELALLHSILNNTYIALDNRLKSIISGAERVIRVPGNTFDVLSSALIKLGDAIMGDQNIYEPLATMSTIAYMTTGNGYYLLSKGMLRLE